MGLYTVLDGLIFPTPTQPGISFERAIFQNHTKKNCQVIVSVRTDLGDLSSGGRFAGRRAQCNFTI
jgi:hypothetical protein